jgi:hypothetical protein
LPRVWQGIGYRPLPDAGQARALFDFAAIPWPETSAPAFAWGAWAVGARTPDAAPATSVPRPSGAGVSGERLVGAVVAERSGAALMLHGPVVVLDDDPREVAAQLVAASLDHATALGVTTVFTRPHGLDRIWVRFGFIPVPESTLPTGLAGRPGAGLYAWRDGSALWTLRRTAPD